MLLYADDTVILAESPNELQKALIAMSDYCYIWGLKVNTAKPKIVVLCKSKRGLNNINPLEFEGNILEIVYCFHYIGDLIFI
jgi:hypothetical protein